MRHFLCLLVSTSLFACSAEDDTESAKGDAALREAALTFDGADATDEPAKIAHGERLAAVLGCKGCHRPNLQGGNMSEFEPELDGIYASNLTTELPKMDDRALRRLLLKGVHPMRGEMWLMPSGVISRVSDPDVDALIAYLRTLEEAGKPTPPTRLTDVTREMVETGELSRSSAQVRQFAEAQMPDLGPDHRWGRYLTSTTCAECHGPSLEGSGDFAPDLAIAAAYSDDELRKLLTEGVGKDGRDLGLMSFVGVEHFSHLTERERDAIIAYVKARAARVSEPPRTATAPQ